jgi:hypothetical protein
MVVYLVEVNVDLYKDAFFKSLVVSSGLVHMTLYLIFWVVVVVGFQVILVL